MPSVNLDILRCPYGLPMHKILSTSGVTCSMVGRHASEAAYAMHTVLRGGIQNMASSGIEAIGAAGIHIEDQETPKRCGHYEGKE